MLLFCFLFSLGPLLDTYEYYWYLLSLLGVIGVIFIVGRIKKSFSSKEMLFQCVEHIEKTSFLYLLISILGMIISYLYDSALFKFWISMFILDLFGCITYFWKSK